MPAHLPSAVNAAQIGAMNDPAVITLPFPDAQARTRIGDDLDTNLLVEAGAGSGKTTELVTRMVALVASGVATVDEIAAVTFTRKAAAALRERFQMHLEERVAEPSEADSDRLVRDRLTTALDDIDRVFVGTIHAFCSRLLRERPLEVGLDPAFEELAVEERLRLHRQFWESYLERLTRDADPILEDLSDAGLRPSRLRGLFGHLVENPDVHFPTDEPQPPSAAELGEVRVTLDELVDRAWELMPDHEPKRGWDSLQKKLRTLHFTRDVTGWKEPADFFEALSGICKPGPRGHSITQNRWRDGAMAKALCKRVDEFGVRDTPARNLVNRWYAHRYALAVRLAHHAALEFAEHRKRTARLDFQDLLLLTAELLRSNPDVRRQLGRRYRRLLVDEFQDTDPLQAEIILLLSSDPDVDEVSQAEDGPADIDDVSQIDDDPVGRDGWRSAVPRDGALFVVGDPKQSIYRFRRADIQLYGFVKDRFSDFGAVLELTTNFRSCPPIGDLVNEVFDAEEFFPASATAEQAGFEPLNTRPGELSSSEGVFWYSVAPDAARGAAAADDDAMRIASWIASRVASGERSSGDFMILTRMRSHLDRYARALEAFSVPVQVTGAGVGVESELRELQGVLACMIDPTNPVKVVSVLVGLFFGIDYERLVQHRLEGGAFDVIRPREQGHADVVRALQTLHAWWRASTVEPADIFVSKLTSELGILPFAAAGELGTLRAGALVYALDAVRAAALAGDASLPGALGALQSALELAEAEAPLEPGRPDVVSLMNLHQAKGLEAEVVILADPTGSRTRAPDIHMRRTLDGAAVGYLRVTEVREGFGGDQVLALPEGWDAYQSTESRFAAAEEVRLLYVAVTRAKRELVVARWPDGPDRSPWRALHPWLREHAVELDLEVRTPEPREQLEITPEAVEEMGREAADRLEALGIPSFQYRSVTALAKGGEPSVTDGRMRGQKGGQTDGRRGGHKDARPGDQINARTGNGQIDRQAFRGFSWGSAVHGGLAVAAAGTTPEALRAACRDLLVEYERPMDDHGDPTELQEMLGIVESVLESDLWLRAHRAERVLFEVPFAAPLPAGVAATVVSAATDRQPDARGPDQKPRKQLDLFSLHSVPDSEIEPEPEESSGVLEIIQGVIDLAFLEDGGWVIADYKTDLGTDPDFGRRLDAYRRQVDIYAEAWARLTGDLVKERVLFFTAQGRVESW
jgi:ATP-dependent helicase/nuclease subunit A